MGCVNMGCVKLVSAVCTMFGQNAGKWIITNGSDCRLLIMRGAACEGIATLCLHMLLLHVLAIATAGNKYAQEENQFSGMIKTPLQKALTENQHSQGKSLHTTRHSTVDNTVHEQQHHIRGACAHEPTRCNSISHCTKEVPWV